MRHPTPHLVVLLALTALASRVWAQAADAPGPVVTLEDDEGVPLEVAGEAAIEVAGEAAEHAAGRAVQVVDDVPVLVPGAGVTDDVAKGGARHADDLFKILRKAARPAIGAIIGSTLLIQWMRRRRQRKLQRD